jgi:hypothetical protein
MKREEIKQLTKLLKHLKSEKLVPPNTPFEAWIAIQEIVPTPAVEVLITRTGKDFLLVLRKDKHWNGWHIPGGFMLYQESIEDACNRLAKRELGNAVKFEKVITAFMWPDHPYGSPLSLVCQCKTSQKPKTGKFFTNTPSNMIPHHDKFIDEFLKLSRQ